MEFPMKFKISLNHAHRNHPRSISEFIEQTIQQKDISFKSKYYLLNNVFRFVHCLLGLFHLWVFRFNSLNINQNQHA